MAHVSTCQIQPLTHPGVMELKLRDSVGVVPVEKLWGRVPVRWKGARWWGWWGRWAGCSTRGWGSWWGCPASSSGPPYSTLQIGGGCSEKYLDVALKIFALPAGGAGGLLLDPLAGDVEEVGVVIGVGGVVAGAGQRPRLVAVARRAAALAVLVIPDQVNIFYEYF